MQCFHRILVSGCRRRLYSACCGPTACDVRRCKLLVVGGGTGGCSVAWRFAQRYDKPGDILVIEPSEYHYYQPLFTLVGAGVNKLSQSRRPMHKVLPPKILWMKDEVTEFDPSSCVVLTKCGQKIRYDFMVVALGVKNDYDKIVGLKAALDDDKCGVSTIYAPEYCEKTWACLRGLRGGHALYTFPPQGVKCSGAAQKILYLSEDYLAKNKYRNVTSLTYNTGGEAIFGVPKYAAALDNIAASRGIAVNCDLELVEVTKRTAVFSGCGGKTINFPYTFLHVTPPMSPPECLARSPLATPAGYLHVDIHTLQHTVYDNVFGIGDCTCTPNSKTAAAVASQSLIIQNNLTDAMAGVPPTCKYDGYGACNLLTSYKKGILAEFLYDKKLRETFPFDQSKERRLFSYIQKDVFPYLYWNKLIKGQWDGPERLRRMFHPFSR